MPVEQCAERMGIKPVSVATYIGKALLAVLADAGKHQTRFVFEDSDRLRGVVKDYELCKRLRVPLSAFPV